MIPRSSLILCLFLILTTATVSAQTPSSLENLSAGDLVNLVVDSDYRSERVGASLILVRKHGGTKEAMVAQAFLESMEDREEAAIKQFREIVNQYPNYVPGLLLLANMLEAEESIGLYERAFESDPSAYDFAAVKRAFAQHTSKLERSPKSNQNQDRQVLESLLAKWEEKVPNAYVFDLLRGLLAEKTDETQKAVEHYTKAITKGASDFTPYSRLVDLRLRANWKERNEEEIKRLLDHVTDFIRKNPSSPQPHIFLGQLALDTSRLNTKDFEIYSKMFPVQPTLQTAIASLEKAFELKPTEENGLLVYNALTQLVGGSEHRQAADYQQRAYENLLKASVKLPNNEIIFGTLARHASTLIGDLQLATSYFEKAINNSLLVKDRTANVIALGTLVYGQHSFEYEKAEKLYRAELDRGGDKLKLLFELYVNSRNGQNFNAALKYLDELDAYTKTLKPDADPDPIRDRRRQINTLINSANQTSAFYKDNQFLKYWEGTTGSHVLTINYSPGSAVIPVADYPKLARAAKLMKEQGAARYVFALQGHSDNTDPDRLLSQQRAEEVARHLHDRHGIEYKLLQSEGFGADFPIASNQTAEGRAKNRRVEIVPLGSILKARISATAAMNADGTIAVSPDGRFIAVGRNPIQLWDTRDNTKVKDLGRGGIRLKFSPNGRYLATALVYSEVGGFATNVLVVYDVKTGLPVVQVPWTERVTHFDWDPLSQKIVYSVAPNQIVIYELATRRNIKQRISPGKRMTGGDTLLWTRDGKYIVAARPDERELQVYDAQNLELVNKLPGVVWPHGLAQTKDQKYLVCTSQTDDGEVRQLIAWDTSDWSKRQMIIPSLTPDIAVHPEKHMVVLNDFGCGTSGKDKSKCLHASVLVDLDEMKVVDTMNVGYNRVQNGFSANGNKLYQAYKDRVEVIDVSDGKLKAVSTIRGTSIRPHGSATDVANGYFLSADGNGLHVWAVGTAKKVHTWKHSLKLFGAFEERAGQFWAIVEDRASEQSKVWTFDTNTFAEKEILTLDFQVDHTVGTPEVIAVAGKKFLPDQVGAETGIVEVYTRNPLALKKRFEVPLIRGRLAYGFAFDSGVEALAVNRNGTEVALSTYWQDGFGHGATVSALACLYDVASGKLSTCYEIPQSVRELSYAKDNDTNLEVTTRLRTYVLDTQAKKQISVGKRRANEEQIKLKSGGEVFWAGNYIRYLAQPNDTMREFYFDGDLVGVAVFEDRNLLLTLNNANEISFYDLQRGVQELTILSKNDNEWIAYTPSGEFIASEHGTDKVFWSLGDRYLEFSALRENFERRDIIARQLDAIAKLTATRNRPVPDFSESFSPPYEVEVISATEKQTNEAQYELILKVESKEPNRPPPVFTFKHQNQAVTDSTGTVITRKPNTNVYTVKRVFDLAENENYIQIVLHIGKVRHIQEEITITKLRKPGTTSEVSLWFLGIAVESYKHPNDTLMFPIDDVTTILEELKKQEGPVYKKVHHKIIPEAAINSNSTGKELHSMLEAAGPNDVILIYISGHGVLNEIQNVVLMPAGSDLKDSSNGIDIRLFLGLLDRKKPGQKALIFLDICHAGSKQFITDVDIRAATKDAGGAAVFSSTSDGKSANEGRPPKYTNGYFAKAILEALQGKSTRVVGQADGKFTTLDLVQYVTQRVFAETNRIQRPYAIRLDMVANEAFAVCPVKSDGGSPD